MSDSHHNDDDDAGPKHAAHEEHPHGEPWLMSYADMMTLLFGFFVVMYSFAAAKNNDDASVVKIKRELAQYFGGSYVNPLTPAAGRIARKFKDADMDKSVQMKVSEEGFEVSIHSSGLFPPGKAELLPESAVIMKSVVAAVRESGSRFKIRVEGHTDDVPILNSPQFPSNWELSGARASTVLRLFEDSSFDRKNLSALAFADTQPAAPNRDAQGVAIPENQARNRRVVIKVSSLDDEEAPKLEKLATLPVQRSTASETPAPKVETPVAAEPTTEPKTEPKAPEPSKTPVPESQAPRVVAPKPVTISPRPRN